MKRSILGMVGAVILVAGCGGGTDQPPPPPAVGQGGSDLTPFQQEHGIGPITEVLVLADVDPNLVKQGEALFQVKCTACHKIAERYVGPPLNDVLSKRSPTYVMNMMLNPNEMVERHPVAKQLLGEYMTLMANQSLTVEESRAILEYLRTQTKTSGQ
ncbi:MAG: c-type cytochrome [Gemmatimonadales bacterium]